MGILPVVGHLLLVGLPQLLQRGGQLLLVVGLHLAVHLQSETSFNISNINVPFLDADTTG